MPVDASPRQILGRIFGAAIAAVAPDAALLAHVGHDKASDTLVLDGCPVPLAGRRLRVLGAGKGAAPMARALEQLLGKRIHDGLVIVKYGHGLPLSRIRLLEASHPVPDQAGADATAQMLELAASCTDDDFLICLLTGGASALTPAPAPGISLADLQATTRALLACGASIDEMNAMRKHISLFGGGQLARVAGKAQTACIIVSDVIGDKLDVIGSGPTVPDNSTYATCQAIACRVSQAGRQDLHLPQAVLQRIADGLSGRIAETPKQGDPLFDRVHNVLVATNSQALSAAADCARALGLKVFVHPAPLQGEAREQALALLDAAASLPANACLLAGGETTVTLRGNGLGGRNQEMALAAAIALGETGGPDASAGKANPRKAGDMASLTCLFAGTDGTDGPTNAAGGYADSGSLGRMGGSQIARGLLENNDSNSALARSGDLFQTGPTLTNVMDLAILAKL